MEITYIIDGKRDTIKKRLDPMLEGIIPEEEKPERYFKAEYTPEYQLDKDKLIAYGTDANIECFKEHFLDYVATCTELTKEEYQALKTKYSSLPRYIDPTEYT